MLCFDCEQRFSRWEDPARQAFYPDQRQPQLPIKYGAWLQLFALSISWRCLTFLKHSTLNPYVSLSAPAQRLLPSLPSELHEEAEERRLAWGKSLLAESAPSTQNDHHLLFLSGANFPCEHIAAVGFTVCHTESLTAVFSQLGPLCILGTLRDEKPLDWKNTRVQSLGGKVHVATQTIPVSFGTWLKSYFGNMAETEAVQETPFK